MSHHLLSILAIFPTAVKEGGDGYLYLKPAKEFMGEVIQFVWPVVLSYATSRIGFKAMKEIFQSLRGG
jgi:hypothetical protein